MVKRFTCIIVVLVALKISAWATASRIQTAKNGCDICASTTVIMGTTPVNGNTEFLALTYLTGDATSVSQTNVTWVKDKTVTQFNNAINVEIWRGTVSASAATTITVSAGAGHRLAVVAVEYSGIQSTPLDVTASNVGGASSTAADTGTTATTAQSSELWVGSIGTDGTNSVNPVTYSSPTNSFVIVDSFSTPAANGFSVAFLEKIVNSVSTANTGATLSGSTQWCGDIATYKATTGGGKNSLILMGVGN